ncbi:MAG TPA: heme exporter protein CcmD [Myxococcota bacterium]|nr:heme exporter protein CcmD [Myxococcota bacterium]
MDDRIGWVLAAYAVTALVLVGYALQLRLARSAALRDVQRRS